MAKAKTQKAKKYTRQATNKNVKADDIIESRKGERFRVWSEAGAMTNVPVLHRIDASGKFLYQSPRNLSARQDDAPFFHTGEKYVEPPPKVPKPTEEFIANGRPLLGWIAPDGRFFGCEYAQHNALSFRLHYHELDSNAERANGFIDNDNELALEAAGWLKVIAGHGRRETIISSPGQKVRELSRAQGDTILLYSAAVKIEMPFWLDPVTYEVK